MSSNMFLQYEAGDTGGRPPGVLPANSTFWLSPAVVLATLDGNYTVTTPPTQTPIDVQISLMKPAAYASINVQVWVCDPTTVTSPSSSLPLVSGGPFGQFLPGAVIPPPNPNQMISTVPPITVGNFKPYMGMTTMPGGHCCLIANCYGTLADGTPDGVDLTTVSAANLPNEVQTDQHVAQHNIFADPTPPGHQMKVINFPFRAATPLTKGAEQVRLELVMTPPAQLQTMLRQGVPPFQGGKFAGLLLKASERPVKYFGLTGLPKEGRAVELELEAHESRLVTATVELDPAERPGAAHAFDVVQRNADGRTEGGLRLVTIVTD
jgi:hypothetical protein